MPQWLRPPNIIVGQPTPDLSTFAIDVNTESLSLGMPVNVRYVPRRTLATLLLPGILIYVHSINNPNYFPVDITYLDAVVLYPINNTQIGSGHKGKVELKQFEQTNFTFPVTVAYNATSDPNGAVILDLAKHCGLDGSTATDVSLTVNVKVCPPALWKLARRTMLTVIPQVALKIFDIPISHTITNQVSFACPLGSVGTELEVRPNVVLLRMNAHTSIVSRTFSRPLVSRTSRACCDRPRTCFIRFSSAHHGLRCLAREVLSALGQCSPSIHTPAIRRSRLQ